jgi:hypothetical protein
MLILDTTGVTAYARGSRTEGLQLPAPLPRDARGRLQFVNESLTMEVAGSICRGTWNPLVLSCEPGGEITAARNTLEANAWPPFFDRVHIGEMDVIAEADGRTRIYDSAHKPLNAVDDWGSDLASACNATRVLATGARDRDAPDSLALYDIVNRTPARVSDPIEFSGPVTALSSNLAVARNLSTGRYEAFSLTVDCGR